MDTEAIGAYSPTTVYGQLTSPFTPQKVSINSHTPYDKVDENSESKAVSREDFHKHKPAKLKFELPEQEEDKQQKQQISGSETETKDYSKDITPFSISSATSSDIINNSLKHGYTATEALAIKDAHKAYTETIESKDFVKNLSTRTYKVS